MTSKNRNAKWEKFFRSCSLPAGISSNYAAKFVSERIQPYMLKELQKEDLFKLGVEALGDQLSILKYVRENFSSSSAAKSKMDYDDVEEEDVEMAVVRPSKAPDRHDVYKIEMPTGKTQKTRSILEKQEELRRKGLLKRGTSGTRISGIDVSKPKTLSARVSESSKVIHKKPIMSSDISSSTKFLHSKMRSDQLVAKEVIKTGLGGGNMLQRALVSTIEDSDNTNFRVRLNVPSTSKKVIYVSETAPPIRKSQSITQRIIKPKPLAQRIQVVAPISEPVYSRVTNVFMVAKIVQSSLVKQAKNIGVSFSHPNLQEKIFEWVQALSSKKKGFSDLNLVLFDTHEKSLLERFLKNKPKFLSLFESDQMHADNQKRYIQEAKIQFPDIEAHAYHASMSNFCIPSKSKPINEQLLKSVFPADIKDRNYRTLKYDPKPYTSVLVGCLPFPNQQQNLIESLLNQLLLHYTMPNVLSLYNFHRFGLITFLHAPVIARIICGFPDVHDLHFFHRSNQHLSLLFHTLFEVNLLSDRIPFSYSSFEPEIPELEKVAHEEHLKD
uniref:SAM domain-containing protein n=1 Tax=Acrobeloides nanus TaxID=290746 RepID=A0A914CFW8_9BILA